MFLLFELYFLFAFSCLVLFIDPTRADVIVPSPYSPYEGKFFFVFRVSSVSDVFSIQFI
jgi:hypothetical protein